MTAFNRTPRAASPGARQGGGDNPPCVSPAHFLTGCMADHDDLSQALAAYEAGCTFGGPTDRLYGALMDASARCGRPFGTPALGWSTRRVNTYRNMIGA